MAITSQSSARIALAALLHDLGKLSQRADVDYADVKDTDGNSKLDINQQLYCPQYKQRYTHKHAAYTGLSLEEITDYLPDLTSNNCYPFSSINNNTGEGHDDSFINAAAIHHKPITALQWIIATADRLASGFERERFDAYNQAEDSNREHNFLTARMEVLLEKISRNDEKKPSNFRYPLKPLCPNSLFPEPKSDIEPKNNEKAIEEYSNLYVAFIKSLKGETSFDINKGYRKDINLWLSHFDSLWLTYTQAIPSATATKLGNKFANIPADVSLYDHSKTTAALATALWRYYETLETPKNEIISDLSTCKNYNCKQFLLIQGDLAGIQDFIFASGGESSKFAAKLLRGRSAMVSLLSEMAAMYILDALKLPSTSQVINAAGKFLIVAENTQTCVNSLADCKDTINKWFLKNSYGRASLSLAWLPVSASDFLLKDNETGGMSNVMSNLFAMLEEQKLQRLDLCNAATPAVFSEYLNQFIDEANTKAVCQLDGKSPATEQLKGIYLSTLALDQINIGDALSQKENYNGRGQIGQRAIITRSPLQARKNQITVKTDFFGFYISFVGDEFADGAFANLIGNDNLVAVWDLSLPIDGERPLFNGITRKNINGYVSLVDSQANYEESKYKTKNSDSSLVEVGKVKPLDMLADEDRLPVGKAEEIARGDYTQQRYKGISALQTLKGDIDNLGLIFERGLVQPTFAKMAAMSRQIDSFFTVYLPFLCQSEFKNTYTVFAGGDDFFLIGPWHSQQKLALKARTKFTQYTGFNPDISFSVGLHASKPGGPIARLGSFAEDALEESKSFIDNKSNIPLKNKITCFDRTVTWEVFDALMRHSEFLQTLKDGTNPNLDNKPISSTFIYGLLELANMAQQEAVFPQAAMWRSYLWYRITGMVDRLNFENLSKPETLDARKRIVTFLNGKLAEAINTYKQDYNIALFSHIYLNRD